MLKDRGYMALMALLITLLSPDHGRVGEKFPGSFDLLLSQSCKEAVLLAASMNASMASDV